MHAASIRTDITSCRSLRLKEASQATGGWSINSAISVI
jgi:hypothetical protein